jgi:HlyD family secretion protein
VNVAVGSRPSSEDAAITVRSDGMQVVIDVAEDDISSIERGQVAEVSIGALSKLITGSVTSIDAQDTVSSSTTGGAAGAGATTTGPVTFPVAVTLDAVPAGLRAGMSAEVTVVTDSREDVLVVPVTAISGSGANATARVPDGDGGIEQVAVELGLVAARDVEVVSGLAEGDEVVTGVVLPEQEDDSDAATTGVLGGGAAGGGGGRGFGGNAGRPPGGFQGGQRGGGGGNGG